VIIEDSFVVNAPADRVWPILCDIPRVGGHTAKMNIVGNEVRGRGGVKAHVVSRVVSRKSAASARPSAVV
jgi:hypothetical protein